MNWLQCKFLILEKLAERLSVLLIVSSLTSLISANSTQEQEYHHYLPHINKSGYISTPQDARSKMLKTRSEQDSPLFRKCCPIGMFFENGTSDCVNVGELNVNQSFEFLNPKDGRLVSWEEVNPQFFYWELECSQSLDLVEFWEENDCIMEFHPTTDNRAAFIGAYRDWEYLDRTDEFCMDLQRNGPNVLARCMGNNGTIESKRRYKARVSLVYMLSMYIGAVFHGMTTAVYLITWEKQNVHGMTLCNCTGSLFFMQFFLGTAHLLGKLGNARKRWFCVGNGIFGQYFMISAFTWLLVVNFDLWITFRAVRPDSSRNRRKFVKYAGFGWGFPSLIVLISVCLNYTFRCRTSGVPIPEYGDDICFVAPWAQGYYIYYILSALIVLSIFYSILTLIGLYNYKKDTTELRSTKIVDDKKNIFLFLKLSVLMGLTWIFEVLSWATTREGEVGNVLWIILDMYNALSSILIFIIFVCKKSILDLLADKSGSLLLLKSDRKSEVVTTQL